MKTKLFATILVAISLATSTYAADASNTKVPKVETFNSIHYVTLDAETPYGRSYQHGAALKYVIHKGIAQWKQWVNEFLGKQDTDIEIAEFIHDTDFLDGIRKHTPELYEELKGIAKGAEIDFNTLYAFQMFDEFAMYAAKIIGSLIAAAWACIRERTCRTSSARTTTCRDTTKGRRQFCGSSIRVDTKRSSSHGLAALHKMVSTTRTSASQ